MKASAGGEDEISIEMIRTVWEEIGDHTCKLVRKMWRQGSEGEEWSEETCRAIVWLLWKQKGKIKDLDNYRGVCLLCVCVG